MSSIPKAYHFITLTRSIWLEVNRWPLSLIIGIVMMGIVIFLGLFASLVTPYDPLFQDYDAFLLPPSLSHPFGTDAVGRDILSRVLYGIRIDLTIGFFLTYVPLVIGVVVGTIAGYARGWLDTVLMRILDIALAFPFFVLIIVILSILGPGVKNIFVAIFAVAWTMYARLTRAEMMVEYSKDYMAAARSLGYGTGRIIFRHAIPNIINSSIVFSMADYVLNISMLAALSFMGFGIQPPVPEWGSMIAEGRDHIFDAWWIATLPGFALVFTGVGFSLLGEGLAHRFGQRSHTLI
jgi:peptide/nickel transport system permease protein